MGSTVSLLVAIVFRNSQLETANSRLVVALAHCLIFRFCSCQQMHRATELRVGQGCYTRGHECGGTLKLLEGCVVGILEALDVQGGKL